MISLIFFELVASYIPAVILITLCLLMLYLVLHNHRSVKNLPPGPKGYPLIGNLFLLFKSAPNEITKLTKQYKRIYRLTSFGQNIIILGNYEIIKQAFINKGDIFSGRPQNMYLFEWLHQGKGIILSEGNLWKQHHRFGVSTLRDFGLGKTVMENVIQQEIENMLHFFKATNGEPFNPYKLFANGIANVILNMISKRRLKYEDPQLTSILESVESISVISRSSNPIHFIPALRFVMPEFKKANKSLNDFRQFLNNIIEEHIEQFDQDNICDYIDAYLQKMKEEENKAITDTLFTKQQLLYSIEDLFLAGTETTSSALYWSSLFMLHHSDIQEKVQEEIDSVLHGNRMVKWSDRNQMPFTEATILEILRMANIVILNVPHKTLEDTTLDGYYIQKDSIVLCDMSSIHNDLDYWIDTDKFNPSRFLNEDGSLKRNMESFIPFSIGKRSCIGESLARMELFMFFVSLLQHFTLKTPKNEIPPSFNDYYFGQVKHPLPFKICTIPK